MTPDASQLRVHIATIGSLAAAFLLAFPGVPVSAAAAGFRFRTAHVPVHVPARTDRVWAADFDRDGDDDLLVEIGSDGRLAWLESRGDWGFAPLHELPDTAGGGAILFDEDRNAFPDRVEVVDGGRLRGPLQDLAATRAGDGSGRVAVLQTPQDRAGRAPPDGPPRGDRCRGRG